MASYWLLASRQGLVQVVFLAAREGLGPGGGADAVDVAVVKVVQAADEPGLVLVAEHELQDVGELVHVLAGVVEVHDLGGLGNLAVAMLGQISKAPGGTGLPLAGNAS